MQFVYKRTGGPLLDWSGSTPPYQSRAGETRSLGAFYPTTRTSSALRRYGGVSRGHGGAAVPYRHNRALGSDPDEGGQYSLRGLDIPMPGAPEIVNGYESPAPGAAIVHLGHDCTWDEAHRRSHELMGGYMPEGAARTYGQTMLAADEPAKPAPFDMGLLRKASVLAAAYHGVKRHNGSILWGLLWAAAAYVTPLYGTLVPALGIAQGFGQPKIKTNPGRFRFKGTAAKRARRRIAARKERRARTRKLPSRTRRKTALYIRTRARTKRGY